MCPRRGGKAELMQIAQHTDEIRSCNANFTVRAPRWNSEKNALQFLELAFPKDSFSQTLNMHHANVIFAFRAFAFILVLALFFFN